jgi:hypothetical protein
MWPGPPIRSHSASPQKRCLLVDPQEPTFESSREIVREREEERDDEATESRLSSTQAKKNKQQSWDEIYTELVSFQKKYGHFNATHDYTGATAHASLARWVTKQKRMKQELDRTRIQRLDKIGFDWNKQSANYDIRWNQSYEKFKIHWQQKRELTIPSDTVLSRRVQSQRAKSVQQTLRQDRKEKLDQIGFAWDTRVYKHKSEGNTTQYDKKWKDMHDKLVEFHAEHGHSIVPRGYSDSKLYVWTATQRVLYREERIQENRKQSLEDLGFVWKDNPYDAESSLYQRHWDEMFERLVRFKESHGHTQVKVLQDRELGQWVQTQRRLYKMLLHRSDGPRLTAKRKEQLDSIEF